MFQLDEKEFADLKSQNATSSWGGRIFTSNFANKSYFPLTTRVLHPKI
jgi:hypothetical protein